MSKVLFERNASFIDDELLRHIVIALQVGVWETFESEADQHPQDVEVVVRETVGTEAFHIRILVKTLPARFTDDESCKKYLISFLQNRIQEDAMELFSAHSPEKRIGIFFY